MKKNQHDLKFSTLKIKRIIQENKEIGKIANMAPYVISKSLEYFLNDILTDSSVRANSENSNKVYSYHIKNAILSNADYKFLHDLVEDIPDEKQKKRGKNKKSERKDSKDSLKDSDK